MMASAVDTPGPIRTGPRVVAGPANGASPERSIGDPRPASSCPSRSRRSTWRHARRRWHPPPQIPPREYQRCLFHERQLRRVTANTRRDSEEFLAVASRLGLGRDDHPISLERRRPGTRRPHGRPRQRRRRAAVRWGEPPRRASPSESRPERGAPAGSSGTPAYGSCCASGYPLRPSGRPSRPRPRSPRGRRNGRA